MGDGNHSLATAKECYERQKRITPQDQWETLPSRYALAELVNLHDESLEFEPIHRVVFGAEPAALPRYRESLRAGHPVRVEQKRSVADALVAQMPGDVCFPYVAANTDGFAAVADDAILRGMKLLLLEGKLLCEPSSAIGIGAALCGRLPVREGDKVCFVVSGGSVALEQLHQLEDVRL